MKISTDLLKTIKHLDKNNFSVNKKLFLFLLEDLMVAVSPKNPIHEDIYKIRKSLREGA